MIRYPERIPTALAISEIATNLKVEGGGEYFLISRSFGPRIGAAIGLALYLSQAISVGFYLIALVFILFDAEAAFLFPWIQALRFAGPTAFWGMVVFLAVLFLGWVYAWRKGDLNWSR